MKIGNWTTHKITTENGKNYRVDIKHYELPSDEYGIDGGRISKLSIQDTATREILANYDRGWDVQPAEEIRPLYELVLHKYQ